MTNSNTDPDHESVGGDTQEHAEIMLLVEQALIQEARISFDLLLGRHGDSNSGTDSLKEASTMASLNSDVSAETSRALHRVVRAMHDGNCPQCGLLWSSADFWNANVTHVSAHAFYKCPACGFKITSGEAVAAMAAFRPHMQANLELFKKWRLGQLVSECKSEEELAEQQTQESEKKPQDKFTESIGEVVMFYHILQEIRRIAAKAEQSRWEHVEQRFIERVGTIAGIADRTMGQLLNATSEHIDEIGNPNCGDDGDETGSTD